MELIYYFTFFNGYAHHVTNEPMENYWVEVIADSEFIQDKNFSFTSKCAIAQQYRTLRFMQYHPTEFDIVRMHGALTKGCYEKLYLPLLEDKICQITTN